MALIKKANCTPCQQPAAAQAKRQAPVQPQQAVAMDCLNELNLSKLCVNCLKNCYITSKQINAEEVVANDICSQKDQSQEMWSDKAYTNTLCVSDSASINKLCVNELQAQDLSICNVYKAAATFSANTPYILGNPVNWNVVLDDPNSDITLSPFAYTAEVGGYYSFMFEVAAQNVMTNTPILGVPISLLRILVNGIEQVASSYPYISFSDSSVITLSGLLILKPNDVVTMDFNILAGSSVPIVGTAVMDANGSGSGSGSRFKIVLIAEDCQTSTGSACPVCPTVTTACDPVPVNPNCNPCM